MAKYGVPLDTDSPSRNEFIHKVPHHPEVGVKFNFSLLTCGVGDTTGEIELPSMLGLYSIKPCLDLEETIDLEVIDPPAKYQTFVDSITKSLVYIMH